MTNFEARPIPLLLISSNSKKEKIISGNDIKKSIPKRLSDAKLTINEIACYKRPKNET